MSERRMTMDHIIPRAMGGTKSQAEFKTELAKEKGINTSWL